MIWACSATLAVHVAAVLAIGWPFGTPGMGGEAAATATAPATAINVRYLPEAERTPTSESIETRPQPSSATPVAAAGVASEPAAPRRYFDVAEVDEPAIPSPDWALDPALLIHNGVRSLKVEILVSETGRAERCTVVAMNPDRPAIHSSIQRQLCMTRLSPAIRHGVAVPSTRRVEILLSQD